MSAYLKKLITERASLGEAAKNLYDKAAGETRELNDSERTNVTQWETRCSHLDTEIERLTSVAESATAFAKLADKAGVMAEERSALSDKPAAKSAQEPPQVSAGRQFTTSDAFKAYGGRGSSATVEISGWLESRAAIDTGTFDGKPAMWWDHTPGYMLLTPLLDAIGRVRTTRGTVEYIDLGTSDPTAAVVAEGALKPEADIPLGVETITLATYAHWKGITRQALADVPMIESIIDGKLRRGVLKALEGAAAGVIAASTDIPVVTGPDTTLGLIRQAVGTVQSAGYSPNALLMNPADLANADLDAMAITTSGPVQTVRYWGLTPVPVPGLAAGTAYVGDARTGVTWFDRNQTEVFMSDSHADYFVRNILLVLAETRAAFAVTEAPALAKFAIPAPAAPLRAAK
jgi:Phage capsid family.